VTDSEAGLASSVAIGVSGLVDSEAGWESSVPIIGTHVMDFEAVVDTAG
jgi:hypothetical protein